MLWMLLFVRAVDKNFHGSVCLGTLSCRYRYPIPLRECTLAVSVQKLQKRLLRWRGTECLWPRDINRL